MWTNQEDNKFSLRFYILGDQNHQRNFINACMEQITARKYRSPNAKRFLNYAYFFNLKIKTFKYVNNFSSLL